MNARCIHCGAGRDLRPYGPDGAPICFKCAMETPDRKAEAERQLAAMLGEAGPVSVLTEDGPMPYAERGKS